MCPVKKYSLCLIKIKYCEMCRPDLSFTPWMVNLQMKSTFCPDFITATSFTAFIFFFLNYSVHFQEFIRLFALSRFCTLIRFFIYTCVNSGFIFGCCYRSFVENVNKRGNASNWCKAVCEVKLFFLLYVLGKIICICTNLNFPSLST